MSEVRNLLSRLESGDAGAAQELLPLVYAELRKLAAIQMAKEKPGQTLQATALVHEAYLRLIGPQELVGWNSQGHFFAAAAEAMRRILVEAARRRNRLKRGGDLERLPLDFDLPDDTIDLANVVAVDEALQAFTHEDPIKAELVKLRFFGGLTLAECATAQKISIATAERYWRYSRAWLAAYLRGEP